MLYNPSERLLSITHISHFIQSLTKESIIDFGFSKLTSSIKGIVLRVQQTLPRIQVHGILHIEYGIDSDPRRVRRLNFAIIQQHELMDQERERASHQAAVTGPEFAVRAEGGTALLREIVMVDPEEGGADGYAFGAGVDDERLLRGQGRYEPGLAVALLDDEVAFAEALEPRLRGACADDVCALWGDDDGGGGHHGLVFAYDSTDIGVGLKECCVAVRGAGALPGVGDDGFEFGFQLEEEAEDVVELGCHVLGVAAIGDFPAVVANGIGVDDFDIHPDLLTAEKDMRGWRDGVSGGYGEEN